MINGIIKLFYTEVVKNKMGKLPRDEYQIREEAKVIQNVSNKIDKYTSVVLTILIPTLILYIIYKINLYFSLGVLILGIMYVFYKKTLEQKVCEEVSNIKDNIESTSNNVLKEQGRINISLLVTLLLIGILNKFSWVITISFCIVLISTIRYIYINYKSIQK